MLAVNNLFYLFYRLDELSCVELVIEREREVELCVEREVELCVEREK